ncbi:hypothetical protein CapIbe_003981 [Capra ibex]
MKTPSLKDSIRGAEFCTSAKLASVALHILSEPEERKLDKFCRAQIELPVRPFPWVLTQPQRFSSICLQIKLIILEMRKEEYERRITGVSHDFIESGSYSSNHECKTRSFSFIIAVRFTALPSIVSLLIGSG